MKLRAIYPNHNLFHYFRGRTHSVIYDDTMSEPICYGGYTVCDLFIIKYIPLDATIYYYNHEDNFKFVFDKIYVGKGIKKETKV